MIGLATDTARRPSVLLHHITGTSERRVRPPTPNQTLNEEQLPGHNTSGTVHHTHTHTHFCTEFHVYKGNYLLVLKDDADSLVARLVNPQLAGVALRHAVVVGVPFLTKKQVEAIGRSSR